MKYQIIDNFLEKEEFIKIKNLIIGHDFPWFLSKGINRDKDNNHQFVHIFYIDDKVNSNFFDMLNPIIGKLKIRSLLRIKANLIFKTHKIIEHGYHTDYPYLDSKTAVFYINTNNGYTKFKNNFVSKSEENKILIFNSKEKHTGTTCTNFDYRIVINFNYF